MNNIEKKSTDAKMLKNTVVLFAAMIITKLVSAALKIPLTNILGGVGMGYFSTAHSLFSPVYAVTAAALPTVIMRLVAQNYAVGKYRNVRRIRRAGLFAAFGLGVAGCLCIAVIAKPFSIYIAGSENSLPAMLVIAPSLFFCSISAVYRGYYEGLSNMLPTAISQIIESLFKSSTGIILAIAFMPYGIQYAAAAAIAGLTIGEFFGLLFMFMRTRFGNDGITPQLLGTSPVPQRKRQIIMTIIKESLPITLAALSMNLNPFIDLMTIVGTINASVANNREFFAQNFPGAPLNDTGGFIYGSYTGITLSIFAIATSLSSMFGKSALPEITAAREKQDYSSMVRTTRILFKGALTAGLPVCIGVAALAKPILSLLYFSRPAEVEVSVPPLTILGLGGVFLILTGTMFSVFMAMGRADLQVKLMLICAAVKLTLNLLLMRIPSLNISGAAIATIASYAVISVIGLILLEKLLKNRLKLIRRTVQPLLLAILCGVTANICYYRVPAFLNIQNGILKLAASIAAGALVYLTLTLICNIRLVRKFSLKTC